MEVDTFNGQSESIRLDLKNTTRLSRPLNGEPPWSSRTHLDGNVSQNEDKNSFTVGEIMNLTATSYSL
jgi:hypothetical protein